MINPTNNDLYDLDEALKVENLTINDYEEICKRLKRKPNRTELGMFGVMWSEHCCYRNSKPLLSKFPTKGKKIFDRFDDMKNIASNRLEEWLEEDEDISQNLDFKQKSFYNNDRTSIPFSEKKEDDPWI